MGPIPVLNCSTIVNRQWQVGNLPHRTASWRLAATGPTFGKFPVHFVAVRGERSNGL